MNILVNVTDDGGRQQQLEAAANTTLMEILRDHSSGVEGVCGGCAACGTCHVVVDADWQSRLPPIKPEEEALLEALEERAAGSRLSCQLRLEPDLHGLGLRIVPAEF